MYTHTCTYTYTYTSRRVGNRARRWHDLLQLLMNKFLSTLTAPYACWDVHPVPKSCDVQWEEFLGYFFNGKRNTLRNQPTYCWRAWKLIFLLGFCLKPAFRSTLCCRFASPLFSGVFLAQVYHCRFFAKVWHSSVLPCHGQACIYVWFFAVGFGCAFGTSR